MNYYLGSIHSFAFGYAPGLYEGFLFLPCDGRLVNISDYTQLFSLVGTTYGGNGTSNFGLPDMRGRVPIGAGQSPGLHNYALGESHGSETTSITPINMPTHSHDIYDQIQIPVSNEPATETSPVNNFLASPDAGAFENIYSSTPRYMMGGMYAATTDIYPSLTPPAPIPLVNPYLAINYAICVKGLTPPNPSLEESDI